MASVQFIRDRARKILREFDITEPAVPIHKIIEGHALVLEMVEREEAYDGELVPELRLIRINSVKPLTRRRFTMAHELGHWILYHKERLFEDEDHLLDADPEESDVSKIDDFDVRKERDHEANIFSAELLMPTKWVKADWKKYGPNVSQLAGIYGVSEEAMWIRVTELGLIK